jgi:hypothetical protein
MARIVLAFVIGALIGIAAGVAGGIFLVPRFFPPQPIVGADGTAVIPAGQLLARGQFGQPDPGDSAHSGSGTLRAFADTLAFDADFAVDPGPDYRVYLVPARNVTALTNVEKTMYVDLGPLKAFKGAQSYAIPAGVALGVHATVVIWSRHFGTLISPAELKPG